MISRARFSFSPRLRFWPARESGPSDCLVVEEEQHRRMLLHRFQHVGETSEHMRPDRLALERTGPDPRQLALAGGDAEMVGPEHDQPFGEAALDQRRALQPRQCLGAKGFLDDVERLRGGFCGRRRGRVGLHSVRLGHIVRRLVVSRLIVTGLGLGHLAGDLGCHGVQREIAARSGPLIGRRLQRRFSRRAGLRGGLARLLDLILIGEHGLPELRRGLQARRLQQHTVGTSEFRLHKAARIGGRVDEIAGCAAAGAEAETVERDERGLRIAGHRYVLRALPTAFPIRARGLIYRSGR
ncbi:hypothetical protein ACVWZL_006420 [Bradyrhizobium sp. GM2.4]